MNEKHLEGLRKKQKLITKLKKRVGMRAVNNITMEVGTILSFGLIWMNGQYVARVKVEYANETRYTFEEHLTLLKDTML